MEYEWDEEKRIRVIAERGVDLLKAARIFEGWVSSAIDRRLDYGETRTISIGLVGDDCFVVVSTQRSGCIRLITAWRGGQGDRKQYQADFARRTSGDG